MAGCGNGSGGGSDGHKVVEEVSGVCGVATSVSRIHEKTTLVFCLYEVLSNKEQNSGLNRSNRVSEESSLETLKQ